MDDIIVVKEFLSKNKFNFHHIADGFDLKKNTFRLISRFPISIITDKNMQIIKIFSGSRSKESVKNKTVEELETIIKSLLRI